MGAIPAPPATQTTGSTWPSFRVDEPYGPVSDSSSPTASSPSSRAENRPPGYFLIRNSSSSGVDWVVAIENERWSSVPGMVMSTY